MTDIKSFMLTLYGIFDDDEKPKWIEDENGAKLQRFRFELTNKIKDMGQFLRAVDVVFAYYHVVTSNYMCTVFVYDYDKNTARAKLRECMAGRATIIAARQWPLQRPSKKRPNQSQ